MAVDRLEHFTVRCADLDKTRDFYADIVGLAVGPRPPFDFQGYWLYLSDQPVVHLVREAERSDGRAPRAPASEPPETGALDHIAFRGKDLEATRALLLRRNIAFRERRARNCTRSSCAIPTAS